MIPTLIRRRLAKWIHALGELEDRRKTSMEKTDWSRATKQTVQVLEQNYPSISFWGEEMTSNKQPSSDDVS